MPNIKHVRIHIDHHEAFFTRDLPCSVLVEAMRLPKLRAVEIKIYRSDWQESLEFINEGSEKLADFQNMIAANMRKKAGRMGKRVEVIVC